MSRHKVCKDNTRHTIAMACDFFYPNVGGIEEHIYQLSHCLVERGHKVFIITHAYGNRKGVRFNVNGLKVYYLPFKPIYNQCTFPTMYATIPLVRQILIREQATIVHGHGAFSALSHESLIHARALGLTTIFTEHSLFGFGDTSSVLTNTILKFTMTEISHAIVVSHTSRENTVLRSSLPPSDVSVIPNAPDSYMFTPDPVARPTDGTINIVVVSRLVFRKGTDLLAGLIPIICKRYPRVRFLIGGSGEKQLLLEEVKERERLDDRVILFGSLPHEQVRSVLVQGHIFLNTSLTEAFCIAIVEAATCGCLVVSTKVGGVPEVLPPHLMLLAEPTVSGLVSTLDVAIASLATAPDPWEVHEEVRSFYSWSTIAKRTVAVYDKARLLPKRNFSQRLKHIARTRGWIVGTFTYIWMLCLHQMIFLFFEFLHPVESIDLPVSLLDTPAFPYDLSS